MISLLKKVLKFNLCKFVNFATFKPSKILMNRIYSFTTFDHKLFKHVQNKPNLLSKEIAWQQEKPINIKLP